MSPLAFRILLFFTYTEFHMSSSLPFLWSPPAGALLSPEELQALLFDDAPAPQAVVEPVLAQPTRGTAWAVAARSDVAQASA